VIFPKHINATLINSTFHLTRCRISYFSVYLSFPVFLNTIHMDWFIPRAQATIQLYVSICPCKYSNCRPLLPLPSTFISHLIPVHRQTNSRAQTSQDSQLLLDKQYPSEISAPYNLSLISIMDRFNPVYFSHNLLPKSQSTVSSVAGH